MPMKSIPATEEARTRAYAYIEEQKAKGVNQGLKAEVLDIMVPGSDIAIIKYTVLPKIKGLIR